MTSSIKRKLLKGSIWNSIAQFGAQGINFVLMLVLASLLEPTDFGLLGMVAVITGFVGYFSEFGFIASMIQKKDVDELDCNTVYWTSIAFAVVLYGLVYLAAPAVSLFYGDDRLTPITRVVFLGFLFKPWGYIHFVLETKELNYSKIAIAELIAVLVSGTAALALAFLGFGVWSLVAQHVIKDLARAIALNLMISWKPRFLFSIERFRLHFVTGMHFTANNLIKFSIENFDYLLVGKLLGPAALGIYTLAFRLARYFLEKVWHIFGNMLFPAFSKLQSEPEKLRQGLVQVGVLGGFLVVPYLLFIGFGIDYLIPLLGEKWIPTAPVIRIFIVYLLIFAISMADEPMLFATGRVKIVNAFKSINVAVLLVAGIAAIKAYGLTGMAWAYTCVTFVYMCSIKLYLLRSLRFKVFAFLAGLRSVFILSGVLLATLSAHSLVMARAPLNIWLTVGGQCLIIVTVVALVILSYGVIDFRNRRLVPEAVDRMSSYPQSPD